MVATFTPLNETERKRLTESLRRNVEDQEAIVMNPNDTSFVGSEGDMLVTEDTKVINRIKSVPCHY